MEWSSLGGDMVPGSGTIPAKVGFDSGEYIEPPCNDTTVDSMDWFRLVTRYGTSGCGGCLEDLNGDDHVDEADIRIFCERFSLFLCAYVTRATIEPTWYWQWRATLYRGERHDTG
jgi:hypothetical protein